MVISAALTDPATGIADFFSQIMSPVFGGKSPFVFIALTVLVAVVIGQFAQNAVIGVLLMPIVYGFSLKNGADPEVTATVLAFALHISILTPGCSPYAAILYSNRQWVDSAEIIRYGLVIAAMTIVLYIVLGYPLALIF